MIKIDIIIPAYDTPELTIRCVQSVVQHTDRKKIDVKIIIVERSVNEKHTELLQYFFEKLFLSDQIECIFQNVEYIESCYTGINIRESDYKVFVSSDTIVTNGWLNYMIETAESDDAIALVVPNTNQFSVFMPPGHNINTMQEYFNNQKLNTSDYIDLIVTEGFCLLIKSTYIKQFGFFEKSYDQHSYVVNDLYYRYFTQGLRAVVSSKAFVYCSGEISTNDENSKNKQILMSRYKDVYHGIVKVFNERTILQRFRQELEKKADLKIDVLLLSPSNTLTNGGIKVIHNICNALNEHGISASMACQQMVKSTHCEDRLYEPILLKQIFSLDIQPRVIVFSLIYNAKEVAELVELIRLKYHYTPIIVHLMQDIESWFEGHNQEDLEACTSIADSKLIVSPFIEKYFKHTINKDVDTELIQNSISLKFINTDTSLQEYPYTICTMLRTDQKRGAAIIVDALRKVSDALKTDAQVMTFGDYHLAHSGLLNIELIEKGKITENEVAALLKKSNLFLEASLYQGYGMTSMEALFAGCDVISSYNQGAVSVLPESDKIDYFKIGDSDALSQMVLTKITSHNENNRRSLPLAEIFQHSSRAVFPLYATYFKRIMQGIPRLTEAELYRKFYILERTLIKPVHVEPQSIQIQSDGNKRLMHNLIQAYLKVEVDQKKSYTLFKNTNKLKQPTNHDVFLYNDIKVVEKENFMLITGWCFHLFETILDVSVRTKQNNVMETIKGEYGISRNDVQEYFQLDKALKSGFCVKIPLYAGIHKPLTLNFVHEKGEYNLPVYL